MMLRCKNALPGPKNRLFGKASSFCSTSSTTSSGIAASANPSLARKGSIRATELNLEDLALKHGVRLTKKEVRTLRNQLDINRDGRVSMPELQKAGKMALEHQWTRELCLQAVEQPHSSASVQVAAKLLSVLDYGGTALFAIVGTQLAGEKDMNLVGCTLVGCIAAMGGGSLNAMLYGSSAQLLEQPGVFWVRMPSYLMLTIGVSIATFYAWPQYCRQAAQYKVEHAVGKKNVNKDGSIGRRAFVKACQNDPDFHSAFANAFHKPRATPAQLFEEADVNRSGKLSMHEVQAVVAKKFNFGSSLIMYTIDTLAMAAFAVVGVNGAVQRGLHPLVAASSGVTICFGGILRDVLCGRDLSIGGQSYAFAMGAGSTVYVLLRELRLIGLPFPLIARIMVAFATTTGVRVLEYIRGEPLLRPMHYFRNEKDSELVRQFGQHNPAREWLTDVRSDESAAWIESHYDE